MFFGPKSSIAWYLDPLHLASVAGANFLQPGKEREGGRERERERERERKRDNKKTKDRKKQRQEQRQREK